MKLIKFLIYTIIVLFIILFSLFFYDMYYSAKETDYTIEPVAVIQETVKPIAVSDEFEDTEILTIEPPEEKIYNQYEDVYISTNKFYYFQLDDYSKLIYNELESKKESLKKGNETINLPSKIGEAIENGASMEAIFSVAVNAFENDNPEVFYFDASKLVLYYEKNSFGKYKIYLKNDEEYSNYLVDGFNSKEDIDIAQNKIDEMVSKIASNIGTLNTDYDKILYIHDWLVENAKYDETLNKTNKDSIYGAFVEGEAVCGGYSKAFKYLLDKLNIECIIVQGIGSTSNAQENHAWNYVKLNNEWYGVDCTWDDPIIIGDLRYYTEQKYYTYFLKGQNVFNEDHSPFETFYGTNLQINYPTLSYEDYR